MMRFSMLWVLGTATGVYAAMFAPGGAFAVIAILIAATIAWESRGRFWNVLAWALARPWGLKLLKAVSHPYIDIYNEDNSLYMVRLWVLNPYRKDSLGDTLPARYTWLPSVRLHRIMRPDSDRHMHTHPWVARTIVLSGWYIEDRLVAHTPDGHEVRSEHTRLQGYTGPFPADTVHRITEVSPGGVWTLFFTWEKLDSWYFLVEGKMIQYRDYFAGRRTP